MYITQFYSIMYPRMTMQFWYIRGTKYCRRKFSAELYLAILAVRFLQVKLKTGQRFSYAHVQFIYHHFTAHEERKDVDFEVLFR